MKYLYTYGDFSYKDEINSDPRDMEQKNYAKDVNKTAADVAADFGIQAKKLRDSEKKKKKISVEQAVRNYKRQKRSSIYNSEVDAGTNAQN
ncbi:MAG: hypothetical protein NVV82_20450 [Sporocytophaga sp.]|nr:hypothetical protein [Sporocytophaga sp.]